MSDYERAREHVLWKKNVPVAQFETDACSHVVSILSVFLYSVYSASGVLRQLFQNELLKVRNR